MKRILVVDSNRVLSRLACDILELEGLSAMAAFDAGHAMQLFDSSEFDVVVAEERVDEMTGLELARRLRRDRPHIPVILMSFDPIESEDIALCVSKRALFPALIDGIYQCLSTDRV